MFRKLLLSTTLCLLGFSAVLAQLNQCRIGSCIPQSECNRPGLTQTGGYCSFYNRVPYVCCAVNQAKTEPKIVRGLLPNDCGRGSESRIIGGQVSDIAEFPWIVTLVFKTPYLEYACGGSIISNRYILTAAHCIKRQGSSAMWALVGVRLGEYNLFTDPDCIPDGNGGTMCADRAINAEIEEEIVHEDFVPNDPEAYHDIALLRLKREIRFTDYVRPVCLPHTHEPSSSRFVVAGWGNMENGIKANILQKLVVPRVPLERCRAVYLTDPLLVRHVVRSQICAGGENKRDSCSGDSGGPLMQRVVRRPGDEPRYEVVGVVSQGPNPCGRNGWPGLYTSTASYMPWILSKLRP